MKYVCTFSNIRWNGSGFDVVSGGELFRVLKAGGDPAKTVFAGVGKSDPEIAENELIFPPQDVAAKLKNYPQLSPADERKMREAMAQVTGA